MLLRFALATLSGLLLASTPASAQTLDALFRSWEWVEEPHSARSAALGGALAAAPSDGSTAVLYPAGLSLVSETDLRLTVRHAGSSSIGSDHLEGEWSASEVALAQPLGLSSGFAVYYRSRRNLELRTQDPRPPGASAVGGRLRANVRETGAAFGTALSPCWRVGLRVGATRLALDGQATLSLATGRAEVVGAEAESWEPSFALGLLFAPNQRIQAGLSYDSKVRWRAERTGEFGDMTGPHASMGSDPKRVPGFDVVVPDRLGTGVLFRPSSVVWMLGQLDWVRWSEVTSPLGSTEGGPQAGDLELEDAFEGRFGLELRGQYGEAPLWNRAALRLGLHIRSRELTTDAGDDPAEGAYHRSVEHTFDWSIGASYGPFEVTWLAREPSSVWVFGVRKAF